MTERKDPAHMIFPENRPKDVHGAPIALPHEIEAEMLLNRRIARENALMANLGRKDREIER